jgi:hypothetical protein
MEVFEDFVITIQIVLYHRGIEKECKVYDGIL